MKKLVLSSLLAFAYVCSQAQLSLVNPVTSYSNSNLAQQSQAFLTVKNEATIPKDVKIHRTVNNLTSGHHSLFCWDVCYDTAVYLSPGLITIQPNTTGTLIVDIDAYGVGGIDTLCFKFFNDEDSTDMVETCITYDIGTGIGTIGASPINPLSVAAPNPANTVSGISYHTDVNKNPKLVIYDLLGTKVFEAKLLQKQGAYLINVSEFNQGIYMYSLIENGKTVATRKLVVAHK